MNLFSWTHLKKNSGVLALAACCALSVTGCGGSDAASGDAFGSSNTPSQVYAENWSELAVDANAAKTKITSTGHFETNHNMCNRPADGAMTLSDWNTFAANINAIVKSWNPGAPLICIETDYIACLNGGNVDIVRDDGTKMRVFEPGTDEKFGLMCTHAADKEAATKLFKAINGITWTADQTDCTLGYERCSR